MNIDYEPTSELAELLVALIEGKLDASQCKQLSEILAADEDARDYYVHYMSTHAMLEFRHQGPPVLELPSVIPEQGLIPHQRGSLALWIGVAVAAAILLMVVMGVQQVGPRDRFLAVGTLDGGAVEMADGTRTDRFVVGRAKASPNGLQGRLASGVRLAIAGDAEFEVLEDTGRFRLIQGIMRVRVPEEAVGFTVLVGEHEVVDLGTEFGVSINSENDIEVHVFVGAVELAGAYQLQQGDAHFLDGEGKSGKPQLQAKQFPRLRSPR